MTKADLKMLRGLVEGDPNARHRAMVLLEAAQAHAKRHAVRTLPRRRSSAAAKEIQRGADAEIRSRVFGRARGKCEFCQVFAPAEHHHLAPASMRRRFSDESSTAAVCLVCHRAWHRGDVETLERSYQLAGAIGAHRLVLDGIRRRIDRATTQHPGSTRP